MARSVNHSTFARRLPAPVPDRNRGAARTPPPDAYVRPVRGRAADPLQFLARSAERFAERGRKSGRAVHPYVLPLFAENIPETTTERAPICRRMGMVAVKALGGKRWALEGLESLAKGASPMSASARAIIGDLDWFRKLKDTSEPRKFRDMISVFYFKVFQNIARYMLAGEGGRARAAAYAFEIYIGHAYLIDKLFEKKFSNRMGEKEIREMSHDFVDRGSFALNMLSSLRSVSRLPAKSLASYVASMDKTGLNLGERIFNALFPILLVARQEGISVEIDINPESAFREGLDLDAFDRVIANLVENARKYHDPGKKDRFIRISYDETAKALSVEDNGLGIADTGKVWKMGAREGERHERVAGKGIGLAVVKELVVLNLGWRIALESRVGEGSKFSIFVNAGDIKEPYMIRRTTGRPYIPAPPKPRIANRGDFLRLIRGALADRDGKRARQLESLADGDSEFARAAGAVLVNFSSLAIFVKAPSQTDWFVIMSGALALLRDFLRQIALARLEGIMDSQAAWNAQAYRDIVIPLIEEASQKSLAATRERADFPEDAYDLMNAGYRSLKEAVENLSDDLRSERIFKMSGDDVFAALRLGGMDDGLADAALRGVFPGAVDSRRRLRISVGEGVKIPRGLREEDVSRLLRTLVADFPEALTIEKPVDIGWDGQNGIFTFSVPDGDTLEKMALMTCGAYALVGNTYPLAHQMDWDIRAGMGGFVMGPTMAVAACRGLPF